jgi:hypothetical protein
VSNPNPVHSKEIAIPHKTRKLSTRILLLVLAFFVVFLWIPETAFHIGFLNKLFTRESLGNYPAPVGQYFDIKWYGLQEYVARNGGVDVILIGSSVVNTGIDPDTVAETYFELTGIRLRIYNFGIESLDILPTSVYAQILVQKYHPALLVFGTIPRDFLASDNADVNQQFLSSPWIEFESGQWNPVGFLIDQSAVLRHYLPYRNWMRSDYLETLYAIDHRLSRTSSSGYELDRTIGMNLDQSPDPNSPDEQATFAKYRDFKIDATRLSYLHNILNLQNTGSTRVIVTEMPLDPTFYDYMGGISVYQAYQNEIASAVTTSGGMFFPSNGSPQIPANGRPDRMHLNRFGAPVYSIYLGTQLATLTTNEGAQFTSSDQGSH